MKRFDGFKKQTLSRYFSRATLLDPRFIKAALGVEEHANEAEKCIISEIADILNTINFDKGKYTKIIIINH